MVTNRFTIATTGDKFVVLDTVHGGPLKGRFHTEAQAQAWINQELDKIAHAGGRRKTGMRGRDNAHLFTAEVRALITKMGLPDGGYGVPHIHATVTEGCFRCELNNDE